MYGGAAPRIAAGTRACHVLPRRLRRPRHGGRPIHGTPHARLRSRPETESRVALRYDETIAWLQGLEVAKGWDLKLDRMRQALAVRGHPERQFRALHVAGTNGKGSTAAMLESVLRAAGHRTGLYTSPHLVDFAERIRAGGRTIPHADVVALVAEQREALARAGIALTHFEFSTLIAVEWFARIGIEVGVIEVGLGGRLDATNTVRPIATAITSIALDHEEWLGSEVRQIALEKAGIAKPSVPMVLGRLIPEAETAITEHAVAVGVPLTRAGRDGTLDPADGGLTLHGPGRARREGLSLGLEAPSSATTPRLRCCSWRPSGTASRSRSRRSARDSPGSAGPAASRWFATARSSSSTARTTPRGWTRWRPSCLGSSGIAA